MGAQQMLLIVLVAVVVGLAVATGLKLFDSYSQDSDRDRMAAHIPVIVAYYETCAAKTLSMGGGHGQYTGCTVPQKLLDTPSGTFVCTPNGNWILIQGTGTVVGRDNRTNTRITAIFANKQLTTLVNN